jgi:hypothetical protein
MALPSVAVDAVRDNPSGGGKLLAVIQRCLSGEPFGSSVVALLIFDRNLRHHKGRLVAVLAQQATCVTVDF